MPTAAPAKTPIDLAQYGREVEAGLPCERTHLDAALERQNFFDFEGSRWESKFKRDAESSFDYQGRPHRPSGFLRECVEILTEHLYCPGPARKWTEPAGDELLQRVYSDNLVDAVLQEADTRSTLNGYCGIQIDAAKGDYKAKPVTYRLWPRHRIVAWEDPDDSTCAVAVCTIDRYDLRTRYRLWSDTEVWTYLTKRADQTSGGQVATIHKREPHDYGCLPFTFIHYRLPICDFEVSAAGEFLHAAEIRIDNRLNDLDEAIRKHINPVPVAEGVPSDWKPVVEPMRFIRMPRSSPRIGASGGYEPGEFARLYFLQPQVDVSGAWADLTSYMNQALRAARVPIQATLIDEAPGVISGIALLLNEAPLFKRARMRRGIFRVYEQDLAKRTLLCVGHHYGLPELVNAATKGRLTQAWPQPSIPVPTGDSLELLLGEVAARLKSHLQAIQQWYTVDREQALEIARQIDEDDRELGTVSPKMAAVVTARLGVPAEANAGDPNEATAASETSGDGPGGTGEEDVVEDTDADYER